MPRRAGRDRRQPVSSFLLEAERGERSIDLRRCRGCQVPVLGRIAPGGVELQRSPAHQNGLDTVWRELPCQEIERDQATTLRVRLIVQTVEPRLRAATSHRPSIGRTRIPAGLAASIVAHAVTFLVLASASPWRRTPTARRRRSRRPTRLNGIEGDDRDACHLRAVTLSDVFVDCLPAMHGRRRLRPTG